jgi:dGTPase
MTEEKRARGSPAGRTGQRGASRRDSADDSREQAPARPFPTGYSTTENFAGAEPSGAAGSPPDTGDNHCPLPVEAVAETTGSVDPPPEGAGDHLPPLPDEATAEPPEAHGPPPGRAKDYLRERRHPVVGDANPQETRSQEQRDRDRLLYTTELRRLAAVTQVVSATEGYVFHNRLTHTVKVAQVARRLAERFRSEQAALVGEVYGDLDPDLAEAAALAHDLGHPPFGHVAEETLDSLLKAAGTLDGFEGNAQSFRIVCRTAVRRGDEIGLNLTRGTLNAILKYPWRRKSSGKEHKKWGYYSTEAADFEYARQDYPFGDTQPSPEAELMTLADDITYSVHDMHDFYQAGLIPLDRLKSDNPDELEAFISGVRSRVKDGTLNEYPDEELRNRFATLLQSVEAPAPFNGSRRHQVVVQQNTSKLITRFVNAITISQNPIQDARSFTVDPEREVEIELLQQLTWHYVILHPSLATLQHGQRRMIDTLLKVFLDAVNSGSASGWSILPLNAREEMQRLNLEHGYAIPADARMRVAADAVAGMTEHQVIHMYQRLTGTGPGSVLDRIVV